MLSTIDLPRALLKTCTGETSAMFGRHFHHPLPDATGLVHKPEGFTKEASHRHTRFRSCGAIAPITYSDQEMSTCGSLWNLRLRSCVKVRLWFRGTRRCDSQDQQVCTTAHKFKYSGGPAGAACLTTVLGDIGSRDDPACRRSDDCSISVQPSFCRRLRQAAKPCEGITRFLRVTSQVLMFAALTGSGGSDAPENREARSAV